MSVQLDDGGGEALRVLITGMGIDVHISTAATRLGAAPATPPSTTTRP